MFFAMQKTAFHEFELFAEKVLLELKCKNTSLELLRTPETDFHDEFEIFLQKKSLELKCTKHFFRASKNTNSVFSATKHKLRDVRPQMLKNFFLSQKKLLNVILRAKLNYMKNYYF